MNLNAETFNLILLALFLVLIFISLLAGLAGLIKGLYKTSVKTLIKAILILVLILLTPTISSWIGNLKVIKDSNTQTEYSLIGYIGKMIYENFNISPMNGMSIYETCVLLATSIVAYLVFFAEMIILQIFISLISTIFYHGIFRWIIPIENKKERKERKRLKKLSKSTDSQFDNEKVKGKNEKNKSLLLANVEIYDEKSDYSLLTNNLFDENGNEITYHGRKKYPLLRFPGFLLGTAQEFMFLIILMAPISSIVKFGVNNKDLVKEGLTYVDSIDESEAEEYSSYLDVYDKSTYSKVLNFASLNDLVMNKASTIELNGQNVYILGLASSISDIAKPFINDGTVSYDKAASQVTINLSSLLAVDTIDSLVKKLIDSPMIMALIPPLIDVAMNYVSVPGFSVESLDFTNIDWSNEINIVKSIYDVVYSGLVKPIVTPDGFNFDNFKLEISKMSDEEINSYIDALKKLGSLDIVKKNISTILAGVGRNLENEGLEILPTSSEAYNDVNWSDDLEILGSVAFNFFKILNIDISADLNINQLNDQFVSCIKDDVKREEIENLICGTKDNKGLLDTDILSVLSLGDIIESGLSQVEQIEKYVNEVDIKGVIEPLTISELKKEFQTMFDIADILFAENSKLDIFNLDVDKIDFFDDETIMQFDSLLEQNEKSVIFKELYPSVMKAVLFNNSGEFSQYLFGLTAYNFNFESENFIGDFRTLMNLLPQVKDMQELIEDKNKSSEQRLVEFKEYVPLIKQILNIVTNSNFLNSDVKTGITSTKQKNLNIQTVIKNVFSLDMFKDLNLVVPTLEDLQELNWGDGNDNGEIAMLCDAIIVASDNAKLITSSSLSLKNIDNVDSLVSLAKECFDSELLSPSILQIIDTKLNDYFKDMGIPFSLNEMRTEMWKDDCDIYGEILKVFLELDLDNIDDLASIDFNKVDADKLNVILTLLSKTDIIKTATTDSDKLGYTLYSILKKKDLFKEFGVDTLDSNLFNVGDDKWSTSSKQIEFEGLEGSYTYSTSGEIYELCEFIKKAQDIGFDKLKNGDIPAGFITSIEDNIVNSQILKNSTVELLKVIVSEISLGDSYNNVFDALDFDYLKELSDDELKSELEMIDFILELANTKVDGGDKNVMEAILSDFFNLKNVYIDKNDTQKGTLFDKFSILIYKVSRSKLFTHYSSNYSLNPISILIEDALKEMDMVGKATLEVNSTVLQQAVLDALCKEIEEDEWANEGDHFVNIIDEMQGLNNDAITLIGEKLTYDKAYALFSEMNKSALFHRYPIGMVEDAFYKKGLNSYLIDPETGLVPHYVNFEVHLTNSSDDVSYWNSEYEHLLKMVLSEGGLKELFSDENATFSSVDFKTIDLKFIYHLGCMDIFKETRSYILLNIMRNYSTDDFQIEKIFKEASITPYKENKTAYRFEELFFRNPKLLNSNNELDEELATKDLTLLQSAIDLVLKSAPEVDSEDDITNISIDFYSLNNSCYLLEGTTLYRSDFTSELVAGLETIFVSNENFTSTLGALSTVDFYANNYALVNPIEGNALNGYIEFSKLINTLSTEKYYFTKAELQKVYQLFGVELSDCTIIDTDELKVFTYFLTNYKGSNYNSTLALLNDTTLLNVYVLKNNTNIPSSISSITTDNGSSKNYYTLISSLDIQ